MGVEAVKGFSDDRFRKTALVTRAVMVVAFVFFASGPAAWIYALAAPDLRILSDALGVEVAPGMGAWQRAAGVVLALGWLLPVGFIYWNVSRLLGLVGKRDFFTEETTRTLRRVGLTMMFFWVVIFVTDCTSDWLLTRHNPPESRAPLTLLIDQDVVYAVIGFVLTVLANVLEQAWLIEAENREIV